MDDPSTLPVRKEKDLYCSPLLLRPSAHFLTDRPQPLWRTLLDGQRSAPETQMADVRTKAEAVHFFQLNNLLAS